MKKYSTVLLLLLAGLSLAAQNFVLPAPQKTGGMPLMDVLAMRSTSRAFDTTSLSLQQLSDLLWASFGINRPSGKRTAPSANNKQEIDIYVLLKSGSYVYDAQNHLLNLVTDEDLRSQAADQRYAEAPVQLIFIADLAKRGNGTDQERLMTSNIDCGYISQNTYLYCTSEGLATGARGSVNREALTPKLNLRNDQRIILAHSVGYPKK